MLLSVAVDGRTLGGAARAGGTAQLSFASIHMQTVDTAFVERTARQFVPRLTGADPGATLIGQGTLASPG